jgi:diguanylate cyclase (GGDEF)-like protein
MRVRALVLWFVIPGLLLVVAAGWVISRAASNEREQVTRLAANAARSAAIDDAYSWSMAETVALINLGALDTVPPPLISLTQQPATVDRATSLQQFELADAEGRSALDRLRLSGPVPESVAEVLSPIDPALKRRIVDGETAVLDGDAYSRTYGWVTDEYADADTRSQDSMNGLLRFDQRPAYWRSGEFLGFMSALLLLAIVGAVVAMWRVTHAARSLDFLAQEAQRRAERAEARADHLRLLIGTARRLTGDDGTEDVAANLVSELKQLLHCDTVVLAMAAEGELRPVVAEGSLVPVAVRIGSGIAGRAADTGSVMRMVVTDDPMFPHLRDGLADDAADRSISLLAAPMVLDGHVAGVLVAGSPSTQLLDADDESVVSLVALVGGGALRAAERYGSTLELTLRDPLTGLGNRRRLDRDLGSHRSTGPTAALMVDIDHFKRFNDRYGHARGDDVLRAVGHAIGSSIRHGDVAYRFGGEEFSVLLPGADEPTAMLIAERVREAVAAVELPAGIEPVTVSVGVAVDPTPHPMPSGPLQDLVEAADSALYVAKRSGRDRVRLHGDPLVATAS